MPEYRRTQLQGGTFFFTVVTHRRRQILCRNNTRDALCRALVMVNEQMPFSIDAWVLLPDHLHCVWTLPPGDADFSTRWSMIKRLVSQGIQGMPGNSQSASGMRRREATIWQRRFWEHLIRDEEDLAHHLDYIHWNPVRHGYVARVADWPYSTFHCYVRRGVYSEDWGGDVNAAEGLDYGEPVAK